MSEYKDTAYLRLKRAQYLLARNKNELAHYPRTSTFIEQLPEEVEKRLSENSAAYHSSILLNLDKLMETAERDIGANLHSLRVKSLELALLKVYAEELPGYFKEISKE